MKFRHLIPAAIMAFTTSSLWAEVNEPLQTPDGTEQVGTMSASRWQRLFFDEYLPSLFTRTLVLDRESVPAGGLKWVFTGLRTGLTVAIRPGEIELLANHYDSYALFPEKVLSDAKNIARYPLRQRSLFKTAFDDRLQTVTLTLDHMASVELSINGEVVHQSRFMEDISRHQLQVDKKLSDWRQGWRMLRPTAQPVEVTVMPGQRHQQILGWGGITSMPAYQMLNVEGKKRWWELLCEYGLNIQREYPAGRSLKQDYSNFGTPDAAVHHSYGDNFPNGETSDLDYLRLHRKLPKSSIWFEYWWQLPDWTNGKPEAYAASILEYCRRVKEATGREPEIVGVQNEHMDEQWKEQLQALRRQLDASGYTDTRIHMNDAGTMRECLEWLQKYRDDAESWKTLDFTASHQYDFQYKSFSDSVTDPDRFDETLRKWRKLSADKPYLSTELCVNHGAWQIRSYRMALLMAQQYHKTLTIADSVAICYCWLLLDVEQSSINWTRTLMAVDRENGFVPASTSHQLRCYGAFSRRIAPGMTRVTAKTGHPDLLASAYLGADGKTTTVLINRSTRPLTITLKGIEASLTTAERTSASQPNQIDASFDPSAPVRIDPGEILTLTNVALGTLPASWDAAATSGAK